MTREAWLKYAKIELGYVLWHAAGIKLPHVEVSCGFPGGASPRTTLGQCWATVTAGGVAQVFVSPVLDDPIDVLAVLTHELIHAWDDCASGHRGAFTRAARAVGLVGPMRATTPGAELSTRLELVATGLGPYPHCRIELADIVKQPTRMLRLECPSCDYLVRTTAKWISVGMPTCPCGTRMAQT